MILKFHEDLRFLFPEQVNIEAATPLDALKLIAVQHPMNGKIEPVPVRIKELRELDLTIDPTLADSGRVYEVVPANALEISPGYAGASGDGGWLNIVIGVVLIAVAVFAPYAFPALSAAAAPGAAVGASAGVFASGTFAAYAASAAMSIGISLVLTGAMQLLAPNQKDKEGNYQSRAFGTATTTEVGTPIPIIFGRHLTYFHLFSFNVDARNYNGLDDPDNSPYFKGKADEFLPTVNLNKFYGYLKAGDKVYLNQTDNQTYRTGSEF